MNTKHWFEKLGRDEQVAFALKVDRSRDYLLQICRQYDRATGVRYRPGFELALRIHDASEGKWPLSELRPETKGRIA